ncbi:MAG: hypothetical protein WB643_05925, partial [Candidatus Bathyarchaeia archaeon]
SLSPLFSFIGLLTIYYARKFSTLAGCIAYVTITSLWLTFLLPMNSGISMTEAGYSAFIDQFIAVIIGYCAYVLVRKTMFPKAQAASN